MKYLKLIFCLVFSGFCWFQEIAWFYIFYKYPNLEQIDKQKHYIDEFAKYYFISEPSELYTKGVLIAILSLLNLFLISTLRNKLNKVVYVLLVVQAIFLLCLNVFQIM